MADTGEDREIGRRTQAHQAATVAKSKKLAQKLKGSSAAKKSGKGGTGEWQPKSRG